MAEYTPNEAAQGYAPYLLGFTGRPLVPPSWGPRTNEVNNAPSWRPEFRGRVEAVITDRANRRDSWFDIKGPLLPQGNPWPDAQLWQLILLKNTWTSLRKLGIDPEMPLDEVALLEWESLLDVDATGILGLDIAISIESWGPVVSNEESPLKGMLEVLDEVIGSDGFRPVGDWLSDCKSRGGWGVSHATLDAIGQKRGVTRERVRQVLIELKWAERSAQRVIPIKPGTSLEDLVATASSEWTLNSISSFCEASGHEDILVAAERTERELEALAVHLRKYRNTLGFIDLRAAELGSGTAIDRKHAANACARAYSCSYAAGDWILCGTRPHPTAIGVALHQLAMSPRLPVSEIIDGIKRVSVPRSSPVPPDATLRALLAQSPDLEISADGDCKSNLPTEAMPLPEGIALWMMQRIADQPDGVIHRDRLITEAIQDGLNVATVNVYLGYHQNFRGCGNDCFTVVGTRPTEEAIAQASRVAAIQRTASGVDVTVSGGMPEFHITCGNSVLNRGVVHIRVADRTLFPPRPIPIRCCQENFGNAQTTDYGVILGLSSILSHFQRAHGLRAGGQLVFRIEDGVAICDPT